ncbi:hypothetical protein ABGV43_17130 [Paenibacillus amylolyticus]|uniref:rhamnogalacturonan lyase family protein n=1 Tax=Paenibacillus amylolyticus TaxID=1451 RepID=UPI003242C369
MILSTISVSYTSVSVSAASAPREMENLGRGIVAVRSSSDVFISWRLLALDPDNIGFNLYRSTPNSEDVKLNDFILEKGTNFTDKTADLTQDNTYYVKPVVDGIEQNASGTYTLSANSSDGPAFVVPLREGGPIGNVWVGDLDGDHEYDYVLSRQTNPQTIEAYKRDGTFLWSVQLGYNSTNQNNISPGSTTIDVGQWDGVNVYDLNGDGKAEVVFRIANGVTFGDGTTWSTEHSDDKQWLAVVDGMTGALNSYIDIPEDFISDGPLALQLGIGYLNGTTPSIVAYMKNRQPNRGDFNVMIAAFNYRSNELKMDWKWTSGGEKGAEGHQLRIIDLDGDGKDEIAQIGYVLNGDGTLRYTLNKYNVIHGDRFYIGKLDPNAEGLQGYGIQQDNPYGLLEYYYNASTGEMIWEHSTTPPAGDVGRGDIGDIDPRYPGFETWSFSGIYNGSTNTQVTTSDKSPWPALRIWWDGDLLSETMNKNVTEKWDYNTSSLGRLLTNYKYHNAVYNFRDFPVFYGDILGDWREEVIMASYEKTLDEVVYSKLVVFTTSTPTDTRLYTLAQNPAYRNSMTIKGYVQSHLPDYYLGEGMSTPPRPNITLTP